MASGVAASPDLFKLLLIALGVTVAIVGSLYLLGKRGTFAPDSNDKTAQQRKEEKEIAERENFSIPLAARARSLSTPAKAVFLAVVGITLVGAYLGYQIFRAGQPAGQYISMEMVAGGCAFIGILGGVRLKSWADARTGTLYNVYPTDTGEPDVEQVEFFKHEQIEYGSSRVIQQLHPANLIGLFRRHMLRGEHRKLRGGAAPLSDVVTHLVPEHATELDDGLVLNQTQGEPDYQSSATAVADIKYHTPENLNYERAINLHEQKRRLQIKLQARKTTMNSLYDIIDELQTKIENDEYQDKEELMELFADFHQVSTRGEQTIVNTRENGSRRTQENGQGGGSVLDEQEETEVET